MPEEGLALGSEIRNPLAYLPLGCQKGQRAAFSRASDTGSDINPRQAVLCCGSLAFLQIPLSFHFIEQASSAMGF